MDISFACVAESIPKDCGRGFESTGRGVTSRRGPERVRGLISFLTRSKIDALLAAPQLDTRIGRRDRALTVVAIQTGFRVSELAFLRQQDVVFGTGSFVSCTGKGRKQGSTRLTSDTAKVLKEWMVECGGVGENPVFPRPRGAPLSRNAISRVIDMPPPLRSRVRRWQPRR
jgi:integrase